MRARPRGRGRARKGGGAREGATSPPATMRRLKGAARRPARSEHMGEARPARVPHHPASAESTGTAGRDSGPPSAPRGTSRCPLLANQYRPPPPRHFKNRVLLRLPTCLRPGTARTAAAEPWRGWDAPLPARSPGAHLEAAVGPYAGARRALNRRCLSGASGISGNNMEAAVPGLSCPRSPRLAGAAPAVPGLPCPRSPPARAPPAQSGSDHRNWHCQASPHWPCA